MFRSCCNRIRNFSTQNRKDHSLANIDIVFSNQRFAAGTTNMYFMLESLVTHQLLQSVTNLYLVWGVRHMSEFLVSPCFPYFLKSCISSKRQGTQIVLFFCQLQKKYSLDYGKDTCINVWIKIYVYIVGSFFLTCPHANMLLMQVMETLTCIRL